MDIAREIAALKDMTVAQLRERYAEVFGEPTRSRHKEFIWKRIAWRLQAQAEGDLSERARRRAEELANDTGLRLTPPRQRPATEAANGRTATGTISAPPDERLPMPSAVLTRQYKGREICVTVLDNGFDYNGEVYRSLSAVARAVTGAHWNGYHFFGLKRKGNE